MKATGIVRKIDTLGRTVIPIELRKVLGLEIGTPLEIFTENESIILRQYKPGCTFCGEVETDEMITFKEKCICEQCFTGLNER